MSNGSWWCVWFRWTNQTSMVSAPCRHFFGHRTLDTTPTDAARESPRNGSASAPRRSDEACDLSADLCDLCDLRFSAHVIPCHAIHPAPQVEEAHSASWHKCSCPESRGTRGGTNGSTWGTAPWGTPIQTLQASETVPKIRTWLHTAVQSGCSFIASSVELKHEETADLPLFNNTFHLNPNCWSIPVSRKRYTNSTSDAFSFARGSTVSGNFFQIGSQNLSRSIQQFLEAISFSSIVRVHETCLICLLSPAPYQNTKIPRSRQTKRISDDGKGWKG